MATQEEKPVEKEDKKPSAAASEQFPIERILSEDECYALTGLERHLVVGALDGNKKTQLTIDEVQAAVTKWLASPVKEN